MEQEKSKKGLIVVLIAIVVLLLCAVAYLLFGKDMLNNRTNDNTTTTTTTTPTSQTIKQDDKELETVIVYKYSSGGYGLNNPETLDTTGRVLYTIKCKNYVSNNGILVAFDGNKFYFVDMNLTEPKLEELSYNNTYNFNLLGIKIDVYSKGDYNGFVVNENSITTDYEENAWASINNNDISFDLKTLNNGYLAVYNQNITSIYNINNNEVKLKLSGNYDFYTYDNSSYALKTFAEDQSLYEPEGKRKVIYSIYDKDLKFIKNVEKIIEVV